MIGCVLLGELVYSDVIDEDEVVFDDDDEVELQVIDEMVYMITTVLEIDEIDVALILVEIMYDILLDDDEVEVRVALDAEVALDDEIEQLVVGDEMQLLAEVDDEVEVAVANDELELDELLYFVIQQTEVTE